MKRWNSATWARTTTADAADMQKPKKAPNARVEHWSIDELHQTGRAQDDEHLENVAVVRRCPHFRAKKAAKQTNLKQI